MTKPIGKHPKNKGLHSHFWIMGLIGVALGAAFMIWVPSLPAISTTLYLFAGFHILGLLVAFGSVYSISSVSKPSLKRLKRLNAYHFGWRSGWMIGLGIAATITFGLAILINVQWPYFWPIGLLAAILATLMLVGNIVASSFSNPSMAVLPMVKLLDDPNGIILDAGCGSGRTLFAANKAYGKARFIAIDRFDAHYISEGGRELLAHNLNLAGMTDRVEIREDDLSSLSISDHSVDAIMSTAVFDHLGPLKNKAMAEAFRVLKPGGRFFMAVWVPSWSMFVVGFAFAFLLTSRSAWKKIGKRSGFDIEHEGSINGSWFVVFSKASD